MITEYNLDFLLENTGCYEKSKVESLFPKEREVVSYEDILQSSISLKDKYWFFCKRVFTDSQNKHLAIKITQVVLPICEEKFPEDGRPRKAIEAARLYLAGEIVKEELEAAARAAADAASVACWAAARAATNLKYTKELEELLINFIEENK
jgi:hypothetical protein